jgi:hypothetical protein
MDLRGDFSRRRPGGQGVRCEAESEGHEEKFRAVIEGATPGMNRSAKAGAGSSLHYGGEGVLTHPAHQGVCGRHGMEVMDVTRGGLGGCFGQGAERAGAISQRAKCPGMPVESSEGGEVPQAQAAKPA